MPSVGPQIPTPTIAEATPAGLSSALWRTMRERRSIRRYRDAPVPVEMIETLLAAAMWAPSAHNRQPWRFCVVTKPDAKDALSRALAVRWGSDLAADGIDPAMIARRVSISHARLTGAPVLIIPAVSMEDMDVYPDPQRSLAEWTMAVQSVALACQNLLLAAHDLGLGVGWLCAALFAPELVCAVLELPEHWRPQAILTVGHPAEVKEKAREPVASRVIWR
ncbi:MAG: nitroreductase family protein [Anaerolineales bacterium]|nr:nitroreductase family protein [Anaerolineales bacterium]